MCSSQTECSVNLPKVFLKRLTEDEIQHHVIQEKHKLTQSEDFREVKKKKLSSDDEKKKKNTVLSSTTEDDILLPSNERKSNLRSRNKTDLRYCIGTSKNRLNSNASEAIKEKTDLVSTVKITRNLNLLTARSNIKNRTIHYNSHITSKGSCNSNSTPISVVREYIQKSTRRSARTCIANKINSRLSSVKNRRFKRYRNTSMSGIPNVNYAHSEESQKNLKNSNKKMTRQRQSLQDAPLIDTTVDWKESEDDDDDEIIVIAERTTNVMGKILTPSIKLEKGNMKNLQFNRADVIANLIDENKTLSIAVTDSQQSIEQCSTNNNNCVTETEPIQCDKVERPPGKIKLKSPKSLGIKNTKADGEDCSTLLRKCEIMGGDTKIAMIIRSFLKYFNEYMKTLIGSLIKTLEILISEIASDPKLAFCLPTLKTNVECQENVLESTFKKYSREFVEAFKLIISAYKDKYKTHMIAFVYVLIISAFESSNIVTQEGLWNCFQRLFEIESFKNKFDAICSKTGEESKWERAKYALSITERWVKSTIDLNIFQISGDLLNKQVKQQSAEEKVGEFDDSTSTIERRCEGNLPCDITSESSSHKCEAPNITNKLESNQNMDDDLDVIFLFENTTKVKCDSTDSEKITPANCTIVAKTESTLSSSFHQQDDINALPDCLNESCSKKLTLPCDYCKEVIACEDLCQVEDDQVIKTIISEEKITVLLSCRLHLSLVRNYPYDVVYEDKILSRKFNKEEGRRPSISCKDVKEEKEEYVFDMVQDNIDVLPQCLNESCSKRMTLSCYYCQEPVSCPDLCQVNSDQTIKIRITDEYKTILIACRYHQSLIRNYIYDLESIQVGDSEMPCDPVCCRSVCEKKALIVCVCKAKTYCSTSCQEEDWYDEHHKTCTRQPHPDLILPL